MTDAEWQRLEPVLARHRGKGGRRTDRRRVWDAIFWVGCSSRPWCALPEHLGKPGTASRTLRRAAKTGVIPILLLLVSDLGDVGEWGPLRWRILRACRRVSKILPLGVTIMATRLGLRDALPCAPHLLPWPSLSKTMCELVPLLQNAEAFPSVEAELSLLHRMHTGRYDAWRLTE